MTFGSPARATADSGTPPGGLPSELKHKAPQAEAHSRRSDHNATVANALTALQHIMAQELPAHPRSFELWYVYAAGSNIGLNRAVDQLTAQNQRLTARDLDDLFERFFGARDLLERTGLLGEKLTGEVDQVLAMLDAGLASTSGYQAGLAGARRQLAQAEGRESIRLIVAGLVSATKEMELRHDRLQSNLRASRQEIESLKSELETTRAESVMDKLTTLANRKHFDRVLEKAVGGIPCDRPVFSLLLCDIDHFKAFNDTFGHLTGDQVLRLVGTTLKQTVRGQDVAARYGGEEFAVVLPETTLGQAAIVAENIRNAVARRDLIRRATGETLGRVTISIGVAEFRPGDTARGLIDRADQCLYAAKRAGRNRVVAQAARPGQ